MNATLEKERRSEIVVLSRMRTISRQTASACALLNTSIAADDGRSSHCASALGLVGRAFDLLFVHHLDFLCPSRSSAKRQPGCLVPRIFVAGIIDRLS
jgi:hypothetical protein